MILGIICTGLGLYAFVVTLLLVRQRRVTRHIVKSASRVIPNPAGRIDDNEQRFLEKADEAMRLTDFSEIRSQTVCSSLCKTWR